MSIGRDHCLRDNRYSYVHSNLVGQLLSLPTNMILESIQTAFVIVASKFIMKIVNLGKLIIEITSY